MEITSKSFTLDTRKSWFLVSGGHIHKHCSDETVCVCVCVCVCAVYKDMSEAVVKHPEADVLINFASLRSAYDATLEAISLNKVDQNKITDATL